jgi:hypothetical protein
MDYDRAARERHDWELPVTSNIDNSITSPIVEDGGSTTDASNAEALLSHCMANNEAATEAKV